MQDGMKNPTHLLTSCLKSHMKTLKQISADADIVSLLETLYMCFSKYYHFFIKQWFSPVILQVKSGKDLKRGFNTDFFFADYRCTDSISLIFVMEISIILITMQVLILSILVLQTPCILFTYLLQIKSGILLRSRLNY